MEWSRRRSLYSKYKIVNGRIYIKGRLSWVRIEVWDIAGF